MQRVIEDLRGLVRLRFPRALRLYQSYVRPRLPGDTRHHEFSAWAQRGVDLMARMGTVAIHFERDGIWIEDPQGDQWLYAPGLFGSALWAEYGEIYEQEEIELLAGVLPAGGVVVDIGANIGLHSIKLAKRVERLRVHAFEPVGTTIATLRRNIERNAVGKQIDVHHRAISDHDGELQLTASFSPGNFVVPSDARAAPRDVETVRATRLDCVLDDLGVDRVDLIKCDVEGYELSVLQGATETLRHMRPLVFVEIVDRYAGRYGGSAQQVFELLGDHGYRYRPVIDGQPHPGSGSPAMDLKRTTNFLFVTEQHSA